MVFGAVLWAVEAALDALRRPPQTHANDQMKGQEEAQTKAQEEGQLGLSSLSPAKHMRHSSTEAWLRQTRNAQERRGLVETELYALGLLLEDPPRDPPARFPAQVHPRRHL